MRSVKNGRPTIRDVAREAGVSYQTVSRVINNHPKVASTTRKRVQHIIDEMGYQKNPAAEMLRTQRTRIIQVIVVDGKFPFDVPLLDAAEFNDYLVVYADCTAETLAQSLATAANRMIEGIFLYAPKLVINDDDLLSISCGLPVVRRDYVPDSRISWVGFDQVAATKLAVQHLIELGHCQIAEIAGSLKALNASVRHEVWERTLRENGLEPGPSASGDYTTSKSAVETGYEGMCDILAQGTSFTAVVIANDHMATGALHALQKHGLDVPGDVSIVSFDNAPHARFLNPPLTTIEFDFDLQNRLAFQCLFELIRDPDAQTRQHVLMPKLIVRESTQQRT